MIKIPGYEDLYWITIDGKVVNSSGKILKPIPSKKGNLVELHKNGQIDRVQIDKLMEIYKYAAEDCIESN